MKMKEIESSSSLTEDEIKHHIKTVNKYQVEMDAVDYKEDLFKNCNSIVVVGPNRSGTTFTGKALAYTLGWKYVDEILINVGNISELLLKKNAVTQCPGLTYKIHELVDDDILVVFMVRDWSDILSSVWRKNKIRYGRGLSDHIFMKTKWESSKKRYNYAEKIFNQHVDKNSYFLDVIYKMWKYYQKHQIKNTIELNYESMSVHELWIDKSKRKNFKAKQTK